MAEDKIFCGSGKIIKTQHGDLIKGSMSKKDINQMAAYMKENNLEWVNWAMKEKRNQEEGKPTHYIEIDTWKPDPSRRAGGGDNTYQPRPQGQPTPPAVDYNDEPTDDLPF